MINPYNTHAITFRRFAFLRAFTRGCYSKSPPRVSVFFVTMKQEVWKDIPWYEWKYQASTFGNIRSLNYKRTWVCKNLIQCISNKWYNHVWLRKLWIYKMHRVSRLIWYTFMWLEPFKNYKKSMCVCHKDDNKTNNRLDNLFLWTNQDNVNDMIKKWRKKSFKWKLNPMYWRVWINNINSKIVYQIKSLEIIAEFWSIWEAERMTWTDSADISRCCNWKRKTAWWFQWKYKLT